MEPQLNIFVLLFECCLELKKYLPLIFTPLSLSFSLSKPLSFSLSLFLF